VRHYDANSAPFAHEIISNCYYTTVIMTSPIVYHAKQQCHVTYHALTQSTHLNRNLRTQVISDQHHGHRIYNVPSTVKLLSLTWYQFLPRDAMLARYMLSSCVYVSHTVRLSVRLSVTRSRAHCFPNSHPSYWPTVLSVVSLGTVCRLSPLCRLSVCDVVYCGETVRTSWLITRSPAVARMADRTALS